MAHPGIRIMDQKNQRHVVVSMMVVGFNFIMRYIHERPILLLPNAYKMPPRSKA